MKKCTIVHKQILITWYIITLSNETTTEWIQAYQKVIWSKNALKHTLTHREKEERT